MGEKRKSTKMNTRYILTTTLVASALIRGVCAQAQGPLRSDTITAATVSKGYTVPHRSPITNKNIGSLPLKLRSYETRLNAQGFSVASNKDVWAADPIISAAAIQAQNKVNQTAATTQTQSVANTVYDTLSKSWEVGDKSVLYAQALFSLTHSANVNMARLQGDAEINAALLGDSANLAKATADFYAPATGTQSASMNLTLLGQTVWSKSDSGASKATINDGFNYNGKLWQIGFDWTIAGFGIGAEIWVQGSIGAAFSGSCVPNNVTVGANTTASLDVDGRVSADLGVVDVDLDADLTLADLQFFSIASTSSSVISQTVGRFTIHEPIMNVHRSVDATLNLINGSATVKVTDPWFGHTLGSWTIINEPNGLYQWSGVLDNYNKTYLLQ